MPQKTLRDALREQDQVCRNPDCSSKHGRWDAEKRRSIDLSLYKWEDHVWALCQDCADKIGALPMDQQGNLSLFAE